MGPLPRDVKTPRDRRQQRKALDVLTAGQRPRILRRTMSKKLPQPDLPETKRLLAEIEAFLDRTGMVASTFGHHVANDGKLVERLRSGRRTVNIETAAMVRAYISRASPVVRQKKVAA